MRRIAHPLKWRGFTLIEVMVGMLIGMLSLVVIMQLYTISESYKRTATSGSDAQVNGGLALYLMEREIRMAGYAMTSTEILGCGSVRVYNKNTNLTVSMRTIPFEINPIGVLAGDANTDVILVAYGVTDSFVSGVPGDQPSAASAAFKVSVNRDGFRTGDLLISVQPVAGGTECALFELTGIPGSGQSCGNAGGGSSNLIANTGQYDNSYKNCTKVTPTYNKTGAMKNFDGTNMAALNSATGGKLFNIGPLPVIKVYAIRGGALTVCDMLNQNCNTAASFTTLVNDVVSLRATYLLDTDADKRADNLSTNGARLAAPLSSAQARQVVGVAVQLTARSGLKEKANIAGNCEATTDKTKPGGQTWMGQTVAGTGSDSANVAAIDLSGLTDWKCYRYKLFQTTIPLRNMIWTPS